MKKQAQIECYSCMDGDPVASIFNASICPEGWTIEKNPCRDNRTQKYHTSIKEKLTLSKSSYKYKDVVSNIDINFSELSDSLPKKDTANTFFDLYNRGFYDIKKRTHAIFINKSEDYTGDIINPRKAEINNLEEEIKRIQLQIDSEERKHPIFDNGTILMDKSYNTTYTTGFGGIAEGGRIGGPKYFLQSGKKRRITDNYKVWRGIKNKFGLGTIQDEEIVIFISVVGLNAIPTGPPISSIRDVAKSTFEVNMYRP